MQTTIRSFIAATPWKIVLGSLLLLGGVAVFLPNGALPSAAQDADANEAADAGEEAAPPPAEVENNADQGGGDKSTATTTKKRGKSYLAWAWEALGYGYSIVFLALSFTLVALFVMNLLTARRENVVPISLVEGFEEHLNEKQYQEAYELARNDESFLGQVLSAGLAKLSAGYEPAIEAMQEVGEEENMKLEHRLSYMALIGTISPMIGLFGTVQGMIASFNVIATATGARSRPNWPTVSRRRCSRRWSVCSSRFRPSPPTTSSATGSPDSSWRSASSAKA